LFAIDLATAASLAVDDQGVPVKNLADGIVLPVMNKYDIPEIAVAVAVTGKPQKFSYGVASKNTRKPVTADSLFELALISKTFTATVVSFPQEERLGHGRDELLSSKGDGAFM
jgi:beta-lactamase class C